MPVKTKGFYFIILTCIWVLLTSFTTKMFSCTADGEKLHKFNKFILRMSCTYSLGCYLARVFVWGVGLSREAHALPSPRSFR